MAAPRIWPSCSTSSRASAAARSPVAASARSGERTTLAARVPTQRADWPATSPPRRAERERREVGGWSGTTPRLRGGGGDAACGYARSMPRRFTNPVIGGAGGADHGDPFVLRHRGEYFLYHTTDD